MSTLRPGNNRQLQHERPYGCLSCESGQRSARLGPIYFIHSVVGTVDAIGGRTGAVKYPMHN
jgi:hypothetical protein